MDVLFYMFMNAYALFNYHKYTQHISASSQITKSHQLSTFLHLHFCMIPFADKLWRGRLAHIANIKIRDNRS